MLSIKSYLIASQALIILILAYQVSISYHVALLSVPTIRSELERTICGDIQTEFTDAGALTHMFGNTFRWRNATTMRLLTTSNASFPLITVITTVHNNAEHIPISIASILGQSYPNLELIVVNDASNDTTPNILRTLAAQYPPGKVRIITTRESRGTYFGKNMAILEARGKYITFQDSDDISHVDRIASEYFTLVAAKAKIITVDYVRINIPECRIVLNRGVETRPAYMSMLLDTQVIKDVGYFDSVRMSADDEFYVRIRNFYNTSSAIYRLKAPYYFASVRAGSITNNKKETKLNLATTNMTLFLGAARSQYVASYEAWHRATSKDKKELYMPFPLRVRKFPIPVEHVIDTEVDRRVSVSIASSDNRTSLNATLSSLINQVDHIYLYLNSFKSVPTWLKQGKYADKVTVALGSEYDGDIKDNGKAFFLDAISGYHFTCDDDLIYPPDYVQRMIVKIEQHARKVIVGVHSINMTQAFWKNTSMGYYYNKARNVSHFAREQRWDAQAELLGTGTVAYHTDCMWGLKYEDFPTPGMMDIWFAVEAMKRNVTMLSINRGPGWLWEMRAAISIWSSGVKDDTYQTKVVREFLRG